MTDQIALKDRVDNPYSVRIQRTLVITAPIFFLLTITPWLVPGDFLALSAAPLLVLRATYTVGIFVFTLSAILGVSGLWWSLARPRSESLPKLVKWHARFAAAFLIICVPWGLTLGLVWLPELLAR
jgi:hypothetical protein